MRRAGSRFRLIVLIGLVVATTTTPVASSGSQHEFEQSLQRLYEQGLTRYHTISEYRPIAWLTREQAAKFFANRASLISKADTTTVGRKCTFSDLTQADPTLTSSIAQACQLGIVKGSQGKFYPRSPLTQAEAVAMIIRLLDGLQDESQSPRRNDYYQLAVDYDLLDNLDRRTFNEPITRYQAAILLHRAYQLRAPSFTTQSVEEGQSGFDQSYRQERLQEMQPLLTTAVQDARTQTPLSVKMLLYKSIRIFGDLQAKLDDQAVTDPASFERDFTQATLLFTKAQAALDQPTDLSPDLSDE